MIWRGLLVEKPVRDTEIVGALASVFGTLVERVRVLDDVMVAATSETTGATILVERRPMRGGASLALDVYLLDDAIEQGVTVIGDIALVRGLAGHLNTPIFMDDDDLDPSSYRRVGPDGSVEPVRLDDERLEEGSVVVIQSNAARSGAA